MSYLGISAAGNQFEIVVRYPFNFKFQISNLRSDLRLANLKFNIGDLRSANMKFNI